MDSYFWLILFVVLLVAEISTLGLVAIWFAGGAFVAFWISVAGVLGWTAQLFVFIIISFILLVTTRPIAAKYLNRSTTKTNVDGLIGRTVKVSETIDNLNETGHVLINGVEWLARAEHDSMVIPKDTVVCIVAISGVKAIVQPLSVVNGPLQNKQENE